MQEDEENLQAGDIEHINWCIFYNDNKITGIKSVPLMTEGVTKKTASFEDIRKYIQQMKQKGLPAEVFDRVGKYQSFLSVHNLKVIIADNPFGATSAVYLWDPMFEIMKQNDIQLIAPGHRIPREITSRFGVSYLLNQDILQDGRMRVVVKDVRVEEDEDVLRYVDPEQMSMF